MWKGARVVGGIGPDALRGKDGDAQGPVLEGVVGGQKIR